MDANWVLPDYWVSQFLTGQGGFRAKVHSFGKDIDPLCPTCGVPETAEHVIVNCTVFDGLRAGMMETIGVNGLTEDEFPQSVTEQNYPYYKDFVFGLKTVLGLSHFNLGRRKPAYRRSLN